MEEKKNCFGRYIYEDIDCMTCKDCSSCSSVKNNREREYYLGNKLKKDPECEGCIELAFGGKCNKTPLGCFGDYGVDEDCFRCLCGNHCFTFSMKNEGKTVMVACNKRIRCLAHIDYQEPDDVLFVACGTYKLTELNGNLYKNDILLFNNYEENNIFHDYFTIIG